MDIQIVKDYLEALQGWIVGRLEALDGNSFRRDEWTRAEGGGGISCLIEDGGLFERGGVNFSHVTGKALPASATATRPDLAGRSFQAMGISLVLHPRNPYVPTVHMNVRFFVAEQPGAEAVSWFGGGMDLTPYYGFEEDAVHFHRTCREALDPFGPETHGKFKKWCDEYFYLRHRNEPRGIGGIFFDDLSAPDFDTCFALVRSVGDHLIDAYVPIVERRKDLPFGEVERDFQAYRRAVTSNSIWSMIAARCSACSPAAARSPFSCRCRRS